MNKSFEFKQCVTLVKSTGKKTRTLRELRNGIAAVSEQALFHHMYEYFIKGHALEYTNDFAHWTGKSLEESALSERLSNIDPYAYDDIEVVRSELIRVIDEYLDAFPEPREAMQGDEFHFTESIVLIFPAGVRARNLAEFLMAVRHIDRNSLYYHYFDARRRLGGGRDDFSAWITDSLGKEDLARQIRAIDPFMHSIDVLREHIASAVEEAVKQDMESVGVGDEPV